MKIKILDQTDAPAYHDFLLTICTETDNLAFTAAEARSEFTPDTIHARLGSSNHLAFGMFVGNLLVGTAELSVSDRQRLRQNGNLSISVRQAYWHQGIAGKLMDALLDCARDTWHLAGIYLQVLATNTAAIELYRRFGFEKTGVYPDFSRVGDLHFDAWLMYRALNESA